MIGYHEISSKKGIGVDTAFEAIARAVCELKNMTNNLTRDRGKPREMRDLERKLRTLSPASMVLLSIFNGIDISLELGSKV